MGGTSAAPTQNEKEVGTIFRKRTVPESCRKGARHASCRGSRGDPGELRSCPPSAQHLLIRCPGSRISAPIRHILSAWGRFPPIVGPLFPNSTTFAEFGQHLPKIGPSHSGLAGFGIGSTPQNGPTPQTWAYPPCRLDQTRARFYRCWADFGAPAGRKRLCWAKPGQLRANIAPFWPNSAQRRPTSTNFDQDWPDLSHLSSTSARLVRIGAEIWPQLLDSWSNFVERQLLSTVRVIGLFPRLPCRQPARHDAEGVLRPARSRPSASHSASGSSNFYTVLGPLARKGYPHDGSNIALVDCVAKALIRSSIGPLCCSIGGAARLLGSCRGRFSLQFLLLEGGPAIQPFSGWRYSCIRQ